MKVLLVLLVLLNASAGAAQEIHFSPEERLDAIDSMLIATAKTSIDFASYALTDPVVIDALNAADKRGGQAVQVQRRPRQLAKRDGAAPELLRPLVGAAETWDRTLGRSATVLGGHRSRRRDVWRMRMIRSVAASRPIRSHAGWDSSIS